MHCPVTHFDYTARRAELARVKPDTQPLQSNLQKKDCGDDGKGEQDGSILIGLDEEHATTKRGKN